MANYNTLQNSIRSAIKTNGNNEITGNLLQQILLSMVTTLGAQFQFAGVATQSTNPGTPDYNVAYLAGPGTYQNMGGVVVPSGSIGVIAYNGSWTVQLISVGGGGGGSVVTFNDLPNGTTQILVDGTPQATIPSQYTLLKLSAFTTTSEDIANGAFYYNTSDKKIYQKRDFVSVVIPYYDGAIYTYNNALYVWNGTDLVNVGGGGGYTLPIASANVLGGIKVGNGLSIDANGVLSTTGGGGGSTNFLPEPDDLTLVPAAQQGDPAVLKFANRAYNSQSPNGMGFKILRKGTTFAEQVTDTNTIYEIRYDFDLNGATVNIPNNSILRFNGGRVFNGTITGNKMPTDYPYRPEMFGAGRTADDTQSIQNAVNICRKVVLDGTYNVRRTLGYSTYAEADGRAFLNPSIIVPSNSDIEINGTIQLISDNLAYSAIFSIYNFKESEITNVNIGGNGKIIGDKLTNTSGGEHGMGIAIGGNVNDVNVSGVEIYNMFGDGIIITAYHDKKRRITIDNVYIHDCRRQGVSITRGDGIVVSNFIITNIGGTAPGAPIDVENEYGENYAIGDIQILNGFIRNCTINLILNATQYKARSIVVENMNTDMGIQGYDNALIRNCRGDGALEVRKNTRAESCDFGLLALENIDTQTCIVRNSHFLGVQAPAGAVNCEMYNCVFDIDNYDVGSEYELQKALYVVCNTANAMKFYNCTFNQLFLDKPYYYSLAGCLLNKCKIEMVSTRFLAATLIQCDVKFTAAMSNGWFNARSKFVACVINIPNTEPTNNMYETEIWGEGAIDIFDCVVYSQITSPKSRINGNISYVHDDGTTYKFNNGGFSYPRICSTFDRSDLIMATRQAGFMLIDSTLGRTVWWNGTAWVDATGTAV